MCLSDYSISSWYERISKYHKQRLQCAQNKVVRFILNKDFMYHINLTDFKSLGMLNINTRAEQLRLNHVFNIFCDTCPHYMKDNFIKLSSLHRHNTRGSDFNFQVPKIKTPNSCSFYYNAIKDWNRLPDNVKSISLKSTFKKDAKTHLMDHMNV